MALTVVNGPFIRIGQSLSEPLDCSAGRIVRITMPGAWDSAPLTFQISTDGVLFNDLFHLHVQPESYVPFEVKIPSVVVGSGLVLPLNFGLGATWIKFRSGTRSSPRNQVAEREFAVALETA